MRISQIHPHTSTSTFLLCSLQIWAEFKRRVVVCGKFRSTPDQNLNSFGALTFMSIFDSVRRRIENKSLIKCFYFYFVPRTNESFDFSPPTFPSIYVRSKRKKCFQWSHLGNRQKTTLVLRIVREAGEVERHSLWPRLWRKIQYCYLIILHECGITWWFEKSCYFGENAFWQSFVIWQNLEREKSKERLKAIKQKNILVQRLVWNLVLFRTQTFPLDFAA